MNFIYFILSVLLLLAPAPTTASEIIPIAGNKGTKKSYLHLVESKGGDPLAIADYYSPDSSRPAVSMLILRQALSLGGMNSDFFFITCPNPGRSINEVKNGRAVLYSSDIWEQEFDDSVYKTAPLLQRGEFQKGIYVNKKSLLLKNNPTVLSLKKKTPLVEHTWTTDIETLKQIGFKNIQTAPQYDLLFKMINRDRADFTLLDFPLNKNLIVQSTDGDLYPLPNVKVVFPHSRHFMVSKKHPQGKIVFEALEKGLKIMRENGTIKRALRQSYIINEKVKDWDIIYPTPSLP
ncbi:type 2 periplasmic-binding domain-containing protein [Maridesulfovibrio frigidus]|uniref:transporter substrate-binding domain-containing protein n=1 Tax=Maridesulfovibrio frigidus TaxID=340956 RepID=UPI0004E177B9|nr:transporter substrate-binding domain-containing protein [Maridesulfovibrio frigidus]